MKQLVLVFLFLFSFSIGNAAFKDFGCKNEKKIEMIAILQEQSKQNVFVNTEITRSVFINRSDTYDYVSAKLIDKIQKQNLLRNIIHKQLTTEIVISNTWFRYKPRIQI